MCVIHTQSQSRKSWVEWCISQRLECHRWRSSTELRSQARLLNHSQTYLEKPPSKPLTIFLTRQMQVLLVIFVAMSWNEPDLGQHNRSREHNDTCQRSSISNDRVLQGAWDNCLNRTQTHTQTFISTSIYFFNLKITSENICYIFKTRRCFVSQVKCYS